MKKILSLLSVLTISGTAVPTTIAASPYQKEENIKNIDINYKKTNNLKNLNRNKRDFLGIGSWVSNAAKDTANWTIGAAKDTANWTVNVFGKCVDKDTGIEIGVATTTGAAAGAPGGGVGAGVGAARRRFWCCYKLFN
ncbi:hypothetical protein [Spiroplasma endosymbiont of Polydrusus formosus]|uniref:hypothetical protein n=1 Tax=Spiroplasma endosymbiont of Polydrusus formosus TaxID=3139326 RepID=UPI0035B5164B